ncbi:MAG: hypothetical protein R3F41_10175 [Gammaproteobacteria bacterium]|nr:hypothetical protein [Pseudomonadales bacterium]MCP5347971.1 hypothetical protein [Pseudomonadales bacterium]
MKIIQVITLLTAAVAFPVLAQQGEYASFQEADKNADGVLNTEEAMESLPGAEISDANDDGVISKGEAEESVSGLKLTASDAQDAAAPVGEADYRMIVQALQRNA